MTFTHQNLDCPGALAMQELVIMQRNWQRITAAFPYLSIQRALQSAVEMLSCHKLYVQAVKEGRDEMGEGGRGEGGGGGGGGGGLGYGWKSRN